MKVGGRMMENSMSILIEIKDLLWSLNNKSDDIVDSLSDIHNALSEIKGYGIYNSISDIADKLYSIETGITSITSNGLYSLSDIDSKLSDIDMSISNL